MSTIMYLMCVRVRACVFDAYDIIFDMNASLNKRINTCSSINFSANY